MCVEKFSKCRRHGLLDGSGEGHDDEGFTEPHPPVNGAKDKRPDTGIRPGLHKNGPAGVDRDVSTLLLGLIPDKLLCKVGRTSHRGVVVKCEFKLVVATWPE